MFTGHHPFPNISQMQARFKTGTHARPEVPKWCTTEGQDFLTKTFEFDYEKRPSAVDLLAEQFLAPFIVSGQDYDQSSSVEKKGASVTPGPKSAPTSGYFPNQPPLVAARILRKSITASFVAANLNILGNKSVLPSIQSSVEAVSGIFASQRSPTITRESFSWASSRIKNVQRRRRGFKSGKRRKKRKIENESQKVSEYDKDAHIVV